MELVVISFDLRAPNSQGSLGITSLNNPEVFKLQLLGQMGP